MTVAGRWPSAVAASLAVHAALGIALAVALAPRPPPRQALPEPRVAVEALAVQRSEAASQDPGGEAVAVGKARGAEAAAAVVPVAAAAALPIDRRPAPSATAPAARLAPLAAEGEVREGLPTAGDGLTASPPVAEPARARLPDGERAAAGTPDAAAIEAATPAAAAIAPSAPTQDAAAAESPARPATAIGTSDPPSAPLPVADAAGARRAALAARGRPVQPRPADRDAIAVETGATTGAVTAVTQPSGDPASVAAPVPEPADPRSPREIATGIAPRVPATETVTAALAWSGDAASVDPLSLAAIQSFMREGDLAAASAGRVKDAIAGLLASVPCSRLQTVFLPETGVLELRGHIPEEALRAPVLQALGRQVGASIQLSDNVLVLPRPQCAALAGVEAVGLPQSTDQFTNPRVVGPDAHARVHAFRGGDRMVLELIGPDYPAFVYADYFDAEGMVVHVQPNAIVPQRQVAPAEQLRIGDTEADGGGIAITVAPPYGHEIVVAFATSRPLYDGVRPLREPAALYLAFLRQRVAEIRRSDPRFAGEWVYFFVVTEPE